MRNFYYSSNRIKIYGAIFSSSRVRTLKMGSNEPNRMFQLIIIVGIKSFIIAWLELKDFSMDFQFYGANFECIFLELKETEILFKHHINMSSKTKSFDNTLINDDIKTDMSFVCYVLWRMMQMYRLKILLQTFVCQISNSNWIRSSYVNDLTSLTGCLFSDYTFFFCSFISIHTSAFEQLYIIFFFLFYFIFKCLNKSFLQMEKWLTDMR